MNTLKTKELNDLKNRISRLKEKERRLNESIAIYDNDKTNITSSIKFEPHEKQKEVMLNNSRFRVIVAGRRSGKTTLARYLILAHAIEHSENVCLWVSPYNRICKRDYRKVLREAGKYDLVEYKNDSEHIIELKNSSTIEFYSSDNIKNLVGEGYNFMVVDECGFVGDNAWFESLRPSLSDKKGKALLIGTPKGKGNWFHEMYISGIDCNKDISSFRFSSYDNTHLIDIQNEIEDAKRMLPEKVFNQEYEAEFIDDASSVFSELNSIISGTPQDYMSNELYYMGVDIAKMYDYTAIVIMNSKKQVVYMDRFNRIDYSFVKERIISINKKYNSTVCIDSTGVGEPVYEDLSRQICYIKPFHFNSTNKKDLIQKLIMDISEKNITIPKEYSVLIEELKCYSYKITKDRNITYSAPSGKHDDCVIALALANHIAPTIPKGFENKQTIFSLKIKGADIY